MTAAGERLGRSRIAKRIIAGVCRTDREMLHQVLWGVEFATPVGLAAGFDYEARLTGILPSLGFGFGTVGTLTNRPYSGNPGPMLGRLPKSRSLMVNKGFKNLGIAATLEHLAGHSFEYPVGVSIGKTNTLDIANQKEAVADVVAAFRTAEASGVPFAYYELNISCPNLAGLVEFYEPKHLQQLLEAIGELSLTRPVWVKMPISKTDDEIRGMMDAIVQFPFVKAVILGNLQGNRKDATILPEEASRFMVGNFSGKPCERRSNELIRLVYRGYGSRVAIVGCGGVFSAADAYHKIKLGASLVQLITGLIFEGPQLVAQINHDLAKLLERDGYRAISDAVGRDAAPYAFLEQLYLIK